jgi:hypothetical protein
MLVNLPQGLRPFSKLTKAGVEALRYRAEDVARGITKSVVREARAKVRCCASAGCAAVPLRGAPALWHFAAAAVAPDGGTAAHAWEWW